MNAENHAFGVALKLRAEFSDVLAAKSHAIDASAVRIKKLHGHDSCAARRILDWVLHFERRVVVSERLPGRGARCLARRCDRGCTSRATFREEQRVVAAHHVAWHAFFENAALLEQYRAIAKFKHNACVVCHEQNGRTARTELLDSRVTLACKRCVANRENLIRDEDVRITRYRNSKRESREHAARIR